MRIFEFRNRIRIFGTNTNIRVFEYPLTSLLILEKKSNKILSVCILLGNHWRNKNKGCLINMGQFSWKINYFLRLFEIEIHVLQQIRFSIHTKTHHGPLCTSNMIKKFC